VITHLNTCISYHTTTAASTGTEPQTFSADLLKTVVRGWKIGPVVGESGTGHRRRLSTQRSRRNNLRRRHGRHALDNPLSSALVLSPHHPQLLKSASANFNVLSTPIPPQPGTLTTSRSLADPTSVNQLRYYVPMQSCLLEWPTVDCGPYSPHVSINRI